MVLTTNGAPATHGMPVVADLVPHPMASSPLKNELVVGIVLTKRFQLRRFCNITDRGSPARRVGVGLSGMGMALLLRPGAKEYE